MLFIKLVAYDFWPSIRALGTVSEDTEYQNYLLAETSCRAVAVKSAIKFTVAEFEHMAPAAHRRPAARLRHSFVAARWNRTSYAFLESSGYGAAFDDLDDILSLAHSCGMHRTIQPSYMSTGDKIGKFISGATQIVGRGKRRT